MHSLGLAGVRLSGALGMASAATAGCQFWVWHLTRPHFPRAHIQKRMNFCTCARVRPSHPRVARPAWRLQLIFSIAPRQQMPDWPISRSLDTFSEYNMLPASERVSEWPLAHNAIPLSASIIVPPRRAAVSKINRQRQHWQQNLHYKSCYCCNKKTRLTGFLNASSNRWCARRLHCKLVHSTVITSDVSSYC